MYDISIFLPLPNGYLYCLVIRIEVGRTLKWAKYNADQIAQHAIKDNEEARSINNGEYVALYVSRAGVN